MHAKGWGAYGTFECTEDISALRRQGAAEGTKTDVLYVFQRWQGAGAAMRSAISAAGDQVFIQKKRNWDLVGNNTPTFFLRDVHNFPDLNRAVKRDPQTGLAPAQNNGISGRCCRNVPSDDHRDVGPRNSRLFPPYESVWRTYLQFL